MAQTRGANFTDGQGYILITGAPTNVVTGATDDEGLYPDFTEVAAGSILRVDGTNALYEVATVDALSSPPSLTLTVNFPTNVNTDTWSITNDFTLNLNLPRANQTDTYFADINTIIIDLDLTGATVADDWFAFLQYGTEPGDAYGGGSFEVTPP